MIDRLALFRASAAPAEQGLLGLRGTTWLAPYDLGVRQDFEVAPTSIDAAPNLMGLEIKLHHGSGQKRTWIRLNKTFLSDVRRQLLRWRGLKPERVARYISDAATRLHAEEGLP
jgi:hypothetical protein